MINAKIYVISEPLLVKRAFRSKSLSFRPFMEEFAECILGVSDEKNEAHKEQTRGRKGA